ncbi:MAG: HAMP domain-containing histidine kinase [Deltaproteobacteria bacterium]|nr:MAG: HAMP domain-containing histidine kinase [Deltaproteobacteria bacterium]
MSPRSNDSLRELQLAFIGKVMAGLSHEFKNHLAIIRELSGLIGDLLMLEEQEQPMNIERYKKNIAGIDERITQAAEMCRFLSSFSHRMDQALSSFNVNDVLQELIYLLHRFAHQKQVKLAPSFAEGQPTIFNNPSLLQFAIFCNIWPLLESLEPEGAILIATTQQDNAVEIVVKSEGAMKGQTTDNPFQEMLPEALHVLGAGLSRKAPEECAVTISSLEGP